MNLFTKLVISLITASLAAAAITQFNIQSLLNVWLIIAAATLGTTLLSLLKLSRPAKRNSSAPQDAPAPRKKRSSRKQGGTREEGEVKWFNVSKGFGFIVRENGEEIFVHFRSIRGEDKERRSLRDGQRVSFEVVDSDKGPQAEEVDPL